VNANQDEPSVSAELASIVRGIVDHPDEVEVNEIPSAQATLLELRVANDDLGQVIGRQGRTIRALRTLLDARTSLGGDRYELEILED